MPRGIVARKCGLSTTMIASSSYSTATPRAAAGEPIARYVLHPQTGKTHQLRVHMNALGLPILGDDFYTCCCSGSSSVNARASRSPPSLPSTTAAAGVMVAVAGCGEHDNRTQISVWSWEPSMAALIADFEARNPDIHVTQIGTADYSKLNSAIQDGYGTPDVVQLEYFALPQYAVSGQLRDLTSRTVVRGVVGPATGEPDHRVIETRIAVIGRDVDAVLLELLRRTSACSVRVGARRPHGGSSNMCATRRRAS